MEDDGGRSVPGFPALFASPLFHSGRQPPNSRSESKATAKATINSVNHAHFRPGSHFGEERGHRLSDRSLEMTDKIGGKLMDT
jgi:hypothetical protein